MRAQSQKGGALLYVLWISMILAGLLAAATATSRTELQIARGQLERFKLNEAMDAGLEIAAFKAANAPEFLSESGAVFELKLHGYDLSIEPYAPHAPLDVNVASETTLSTFFQFLDQPKEEADKLAAQIVDWRDPDDLSRVNGAEAKDYPSLGNGAGPKNRPFVSVDELLLVRDMTTDLLHCAKPALSVVSGAQAPGAILIDNLYGRAWSDEVVTSKRRRLGTASNSVRGGRVIGFVVQGVDARKNFPRGMKIGVFRVTGKQATPFQWMVRFHSSDTANIKPECDNS